jgi:flagellar hook assembly protein FlgD
VSPNPFNPAATIRFELARSGPVSLDVLDLRGRVVRTLTRENWPAGSHSLVWRGDDHGGRSVSSGVYLLRLRADRQIQLQRAVLVR